MKILLISSPWVPTPPPTYGGTQRDVAIIGDVFSKMGHDVTIIASKNSHVNGCKTIETIDWNEGETFADLKSTYNDLNKDFWSAVIRHLEQNRDYDIVNSHAWLPGMPYDHVKSLCVKLCVSIHGGGAAPENSVFVSAAQRDYYKNSARFVHNPIDINKYEFKIIKQNYLSFIGRLDHAKGVDDAIKVAKKTGLKLKIAGNISDKEYFDIVIKPYLGDQIEYIGQVGGKSKSDLLANSKAALYPTHLNPEPFGRVPLEANACGTPCIAYNNGGLKEVVKNGESGYLVDSLEGMIPALNTVDNISPKTCREWVENNFSPELIAGKYLDLYQDLINGVSWG